MSLPLTNTGVPIQRFDPDTEPTTNGTRWSKWLTRFDNYLVAASITNDGRKKALLLLLAGEKVHDIYETIKADDDGFDAAKTKLTTYFKPQKDTHLAIYKFREASQEKSENIDQFVTHLKILARDCEFANVDDEIRGQILQKTNSKKLRREILKHPDWTLDDCIKEGRANETSEVQAVDMEGGATSESVNKVSTYKERNRSKHKKHPPSHEKSSKPDQKQNSGNRSVLCRNCGGKWPHQGGMNKCPAKGHTCFKCSKVNHFASVCRSSRRQTSSKKQVNRVDECEDADEEYVFAVTAGKTVPYTHVTVLGRRIKFMIDTGSSINIINNQTYEALQKPKLSQSKTKIIPYGGEKSLEALGHFETVLETKKLSVAKLVVVNSNADNLLSYQTASELGLVHILAAVSTQPGNTIMESDRLCAELPQLFEGTGKLKNYQAMVYRDESVIPVVQPHRRIPFHLWKRVAAEIDRLDNLDITEPPSGPTPWVSAVVPVEKRNGEIRLCVDLRMVNKAVKRERHPGPTLDDWQAELKDAKVVSRVDMREGYNQIELHPSCRDLTTFSTHVGLRRFKRLTMGIANAPELFHHIIEQVIAGIPGVRNKQDDIIIYGKTQEEHDKSLRLLFERLVENGLTLKREKCIFNQSQIKFDGYIFSSEGVSADPERVAEIEQLDTPRDASEVRSLLGMTNFCARFIPGYADITEPLRQLTHKAEDGKKDFEWSDKHDEAFSQVKDMLMTNPTIGYFDPNKQSEIYVDASPVGLSAILTQYETDQEDGYVVAYASKALSDVERRYSQTDREAYAVVWGCEHYHLYIYGQKVSVVTDHKPLETIFNNPRNKTTARLERYALRLEPYQATVRYKPGKTNPADFLSRHPRKAQTNAVEDEESDDYYVNFVAAHAIPRAMALEEVKCATLQDVTLQEVAKRIRNGRWHDPVPEGIDPVQFSSMKNVKSELCVLPDDDLILRGTRIVIPKILQSRVIMRDIKVLSRPRNS